MLLNLHKVPLVPFCPKFKPQLADQPPKPWTRVTIEFLPDSDIWVTYEQELLDKLRTLTDSSVDERWGQIKQMMHLRTGFACGPKSNIHKSQRISQMQLSLIEEKRERSSCTASSKMRQILQPKMTIKKDRKSSGLR